MSVPLKIAGNGEEKGGAIKTVLLPKLLKLLRSGLFSEHCHGRVPGNEFDQYGDEGDDGPNHEKKDGNSPERPKNLMLIE